MNIKHYSYLLILTLLTIGTLPSGAHALREPRPLTVDGRLKTLNFNPHEVYRFTGYFYFQSIIEFASDETISTISVGLPDGWQIQPAGNRIFIKPVSETPEEAITNMTVITNKRMYFFELHADEATDVTSQKIPFIVRFIYPDDELGAGLTQVASTGPDLSRPENFNFNYTLTGPESIAPVKVFDDRKFTYFLFRENTPIPGIFEVDNEGYEALVNFRIEGEYVVVEKVLSQYTLRYGSDTVCVYNESMPLQLKIVED